MIKGKHEIGWRKCRRCGKMFKKTGPAETLCYECWIKAHKAKKKNGK